MLITLQSSKQCFLSVEKFPVDDAEKFCEWCLSDFTWKNELTSEGCTGEIVMIAPAAGFYTTPGSGVDQVRLAYMLCKEDIQRALFVLERALEGYNKQE